MSGSSGRRLELSAGKRALLEALLAGEEEGSATLRITPRHEHDSAPLSFVQERLWFLQQWAPENPVGNRPAFLHLTGTLDPPALQASLQGIVRRHETLRATFPSIDGRPVQQIAPDQPLALSLIDLTDGPESERHDLALQWAQEAARAPFDLAHGPLLRAALLRLAEEEHLLLLTVHHIAFDGWSLAVLKRELAALYPVHAAVPGATAPPSLPALPIQYGDFAAWQRAWLQGERLEAQLLYWKEQLANSPELLALPADHARPALQSFRGARQSVLLPEAVSDALKRLSRREGATLFMTLLAAFKVLLGRYTGQDDIVVGTPTAGRSHVETEGLIGCFVNTLVLRTDLSGDPSFRELLARVRRVALEAYAHQDLPFEKLVEALQPRRSLSSAPLFQVTFQLRNYPKAAAEIPGLKIDDFDCPTGVAKYDLSLEISEEAGGLSCCFEYNTDLFEALTISRMREHWQTLLAGIGADPDQRLSRLPLLPEHERRQLLVEWNQTGAPYPREHTLQALFEQQSERTPAAVAVVGGREQLTYAQLNHRANQLAHHLQRLGVGPDQRVGLCSSRTPAMVVGLLGILKAGGAYVPLDPAYPAERLAFMLADARVSVLLTQEPQREWLAAPGVPVLCLDSGWEIIAREPAADPVSAVTPGHLAYVIYTSGSTGRPKGVAITHQSAVALLSWAQSVFSPAERAGVLASTSLCFDPSVFELFFPLVTGGTAILAENLLQLPALPAAGQVTLINTVPPAITELLRLDPLPPAVRTVSVGGEPVAPALVAQLEQQPGVERVYDLYGPTEDTIFSTFARRHGERPASVGRPIANTQVYVLDGRMQPVPIGVPGELYLGGVGLARGYLNRPAMTAERFVPHPFSDTPGARLYRTGDRVRCRPEGDLEFLGRLDRQCKVRGFRIEPGEIEAALGQHPAVRESVVLVRDDSSGEKCIVAYLTTRGKVEVSCSALRHFLGQKLPDYMLPSVFVVLEALPLAPNGKVERRALPVPDSARPALPQAFVAPRTPVEAALAAIWSDVLGLERVGVHDSFFDLGGHSLRAAQVMARLREAYAVTLPLRALFETPTVAELAAAVVSSLAEQAAGDELIRMLVELEEGAATEADR